MSEIAEKINTDFVDLFQNNVTEIENNSTNLLNKTRAKAISDFKSNGIPNSKNEEYKYTNLETVFLKQYGKHFAKKDLSIKLEDVFKCDVPELEAHTILLVNGWYHNEKEPLTKLDNGVVYGSLAKACEDYPEVVKKHYGKYAKTEDDGLAALNTAYTQDGIFIYAPKGAVCETPIQIINILIAEEDLLVHPRNLIVAEENSQVKVIICDHTLSAHKFLSNSITEVFADRNSNVEYYKVQNQHNFSSKISSSYIFQRAHSNVLTNTLSLHGGLIRNNIFVRMDEEHCENHTVGLYLTDRQQHVDNFTFIDHAKPNCTSHELYKGVLDDEATGAFNGKVLVREDAQGTRAYQSNNNILLTNEATMNTKPQLEIYADDVKCSHGATIGQIDEDALFYLRARGISEKGARLLLMYAFAHEVIDQIKVAPLKERINNLVERRLRGELARCNNCVMNCS